MTFGSKITKILTNFVEIFNFEFLSKREFLIKNWSLNIVSGSREFRGTGKGQKMIS